MYDGRATSPEVPLTTLAKVYDRHFPHALEELGPRPREVGVLMARPTHFDVEYVINPHMEGRLHSVDKVLALEQWEALCDVYRGLRFEVHVIDGVPGLPDLVFTANQSFPGQLPDGEWVALRSRMHSPQRRPEEAVLEAWYRGRGARVVEMTESRGLIPFEGMGDAHWLPGHRLIIGGYGFRTDRAIYPRLVETFEVPVVVLELTDPRFYHLDTCLAPLTDRQALYVPDAFTAEGRALLAELFDTLIEVPMDEASTLLACNGHCPDGRHFIVQKGATVTNERVRACGIDVIELDTSEFLKSGGSVFCMKVMIP